MNANNCFTVFPKLLQCLLSYFEIPLNDAAENMQGFVQDFCWGLGGEFYGIVS